MPSIPQSLLWISLVVLWLFVLVPMLISKREAVRRTSDVALATRVLNSGSSSRLLRRKGPAAGHHSDPDWQPSAADDGDEDDFDDTDTAPRRAVVLAAADTTAAEPDYLDVDVVEEDSGALPIGATAAPAATIDDAPEPEMSDGTDEFEAAGDDVAADEYEYVADSSGLEASPEPEAEAADEAADSDTAGSQMADAVGAARRRRYESKTAAAVSARKFKFRKRMVTSMAVALLVTGVAAYLVAPWAWWLCGAVGVVTALYLGYLRRQTRIEEQVRRRRAQRMKRSRLGVENTVDREFDVVPERLRRPGAAVLEIDDEDPAFEHLDEVAFARHFDLPRAAGQ